MPVDKPKDAIFRRSIYEQYVTGQGDVAVMPRFLRPRTFTALWVLLALLLVSGTLAWSIQVPVRALATTIVVEQLDESGATSLILLCDAPTASQLVSGQRVFVKWNEATTPELRTIVYVSDGIRNPAETIARFRLTGAAANVVLMPHGLATLDDSDHSFAQSVGGVFPAEVELGTRPILSLLPGFGSLCEEPR